MCSHAIEALRNFYPIQQGKKMSDIMRWNTKLDAMSIYVYLQSRPCGNARASPLLPRFILNFKYALSDYNLSGPQGVKICIARARLLCCDVCGNKSSDYVRTGSIVLYWEFLLYSTIGKTLSFSILAAAIYQVFLLVLFLKCAPDIHCLFFAKMRREIFYCSSPPIRFYWQICTEKNRLAKA